jgi:hypothetical protein
MIIRANTPVEFDERIEKISKDLEAQDWQGYVN